MNRPANKFPFDILIFLAAMLVSSIAWANIRISGTSQFVINDCANDKLVVRLISDSKTSVDAVRTVEVMDSNNNESGWTFNWDKPVLSDASISEYQSMATVQQRCPSSGTFRVKLAATAQGASSSVDIVVIRRPDPVLDAPATATLVIRRHPLSLPGLSDDTSGMTLYIRESTGSTPLNQLSASLGQFVDSSGKQTPFQLRPAVSAVDIAPGKIEQLQFQPPSGLSPGPYTTHIGLNSPSLKQEQNVNLSVWVKVFPAYLLLTILLGIGLGVLVNVYMQNRATLGAAKLAALRTGDTYAQRASAQKDPVVQQRLIGVASTLNKAVHDAKTSDDVNAALNAAQASAGSIEAQAVATANAFDTLLANLRATLQPNGLPPDADIADQLKPLNDTLNRIEQLRQNGQVEDALNQLQSCGQTFQQSVLQAIQPWLTDAHRAIEELGVWKAPADALQSACNAIDQKIQTAIVVPNPAALVSQVDGIARDLRVAITFTVPQSMSTAFRAAATILAEGQRADLAQAINEQALSVSQPLAGTPTLLSAMAIFAGVRTRTEALVRGASHSSAAVATALNQGDFPGAAQLLVTPAPPLAAGPLAVLAPVAPSLVRAATALASAATPRTGLRVVVPPQLQVKRETQITLSGINEPFVGHVSWECHPPEAGALTNSSWQGATITATKAGFLTIKVFAPDMNAGGSAQIYAGSVSQTDRYEDLDRESWGWHACIAVVTACLTTFAGFQIFAPTWYGTPADFFSAFVWGFFGQFGLARVRDLSKSILGRTL
ncbi:hypothetical protein [Paraburkholderia strydomiana]|uniref:hypothetical protein n=1 Tax=Paraburkholderia strydomiana TaxID=1245417 RepID=UPI0038BD1418